MRKLNLTLSFTTELEDQEVIDMLVDGFIDKAGVIKLISVNGKKYNINDSVFEIGYGIGEPHLGARSSGETERVSVSREHTECNAMGSSGSREVL